MSREAKAPLFKTGRPEIFLKIFRDLQFPLMDRKNGGPIDESKGLARAKKKLPKQKPVPAAMRAGATAEATYR